MNKGISSVSGKFLLRVELLVGFTLIAFFGFFFNQLGITDFYNIKLVYLLVLCLILILSSLVSEWVEKRLKFLNLILYLICLSWVLIENYRHGFDQKYIYVFLLIYLIFCFIHERLRYYIYSNIFLIGSLLVLVFMSDISQIKYLKINSLGVVLIYSIGYALTFSRANAKKKLIERKNLLNYIFNNSSRGLILLDKETHQIVDCNDVILELTNSPNRDKILENSIYDLTVDGWKLFVNKVRESERQYIELHDNRVISCQTKEFELSKQTYLLVDLNFYKDKFEFNLSKEFESLKKSSEDSYKYLFEESSSLVCIIDKNGKIKDVNKTFLDKIGYKKNELVGQPFYVLDKRVYRKRDKVNKKALDGEPQVFEKEIVDKSGKVIFIEVILKKGRYLGEEVLISNSRDISNRKELESKVKFNLYRYSTLFDYSPISIIIGDHKNRIIDLNDSFLDFIGYDSEFIKSKKLEEFLHPGDQIKLTQAITQIAEEEVTQVDLQQRFIKEDGKVMTAILKLAPLHDSPTHSLAFIAQIIDITDIQEAHAQLELSEKSYRELFDNSNDLLYILNKDYQFVDVNKAVIEKYGYTKEEILGKTPDLFSAPNKNDIKHVLEQLTQAWNGSTRDVFWWSMKKNGDIFPKELNFKSGFYKGEKAIIATGRDVSESYNYEKQLEEKEKRFRQLFERNLAGIYRTNKEGFILECNKSFAEIIGYNSVEDIKGKVNVNDYYIRPEDRNLLIDKIDNYDMVRGETIRLKKVDGSPFTVLVNVSKISNSEGEFQYFEGSLLDITELDEAQKLLSESQAKYQRLIDTSPFGILIFYNGEVVFCNEKSVKILGYEHKNDLLNKQKESIFDFQNNEAFEKRILKLKKGEDVPFKEIKMHNALGETVEAEVKPIQFYFEDKDCVLVSFIDISYRKKIEEERRRTRSAETFNKILQAELKEKERAQKKLVDAQSYTEGIIESSIDMIFTTDTYGNLNKLNSAAKNELKVDESYVGKSLNIFFKNKEEGKGILESLEKNKVFFDEVVLKRSDNSSFPAYLSLSYLYNSDDVVLGIMGVSRDISDVKAKELEIKAQAAKLNSIIESSSHFFFTVDRNHFITSYNSGFKEDAKNNLGIDVKIGMPWSDLYPEYLKEEMDVSAFWSDMFKSGFNGKSLNFVIERKNLEGKEYYREIYLNPISSESGDIVELSGIGHDITDKKKSEEKLKNSLNEKEVLLKEVHHRVKNNMQVISSILSLQSAYVNDDKILSILRESQNRIKSMAFIHERLYQTKDFSKIKFSDYVDSLSKNLVETYELSTGEVDLETDLQEVFLNLDFAIPCGLIINELISNSLKYAFNESNGVIFIQLRESNNDIELTIADNGKGISEDLDFRNTESLGLQLVNTLVQQLEGTISLDRTNGTKFLICFKTKET